VGAATGPYIAGASFTFAEMTATTASTLTKTIAVVAGTTYQLQAVVENGETRINLSNTTINP
jgi:hypothetical protein